MKVYKILLVLIFANYFSANVNAQYISVDDNRSGTNLVQSVLINSSCATVSNISVQGGALGINDNSFGYFNANSSGFIFDEGIILSTGKVKSAVGPNNNLSSNGENNWSGDVDLETALNISGTTNATILEFDFIPLTNKVSFEYLFSSEQYLSNPADTQCNYTDGFAFLIREVGTTNYQNIAKIPGTNTPVAINTVRAATQNCSGANEQFFGGFNGQNHPTNFNGQTIPLTAQANLISGKKYHIKLVIADQGNFKYDSAVFLKAGSFKVGIDLGNDRIVFNNNALCAGETKILDATQAGTNTYKWFKNGVQIPNEFNATYNVPNDNNPLEVLYEVEVNLGAGACTAKGKVKIQFAPKPILNPAVLNQCDDNADGFTTFNLKQLDSFIIGNTGNIPLLTSQNEVKYYIDIAATIPILNPLTFKNTILNTQTIYAQVANNSDCSSITTLTLNVSNNLISDQTIIVCDEDAIQDGFRSTNISLEITPKLLIFFPAGANDIKFYKSKEDAISETNSFPNTFINTTANEQILFGRIFAGADCFAIVKIILKVFSFDSNTFKDETKFICPNKSLTLEVPTGFSYEWSNGNVIDNFINVSTSGLYTVKVTKGLCSFTKKFDVKNADLAVINSIDVNDFNNDDNSIQVNYSGTGDYEFSIDGINFQDNSLFTNVSIGEYLVTIRDKNNCEDVVSNKVFVLDFPKFFSPNNDGFNDIWDIKNLNKPAKITIYDRFGKLIYLFENNSGNWNGTFDQELMPADDYWFTIILENNRIIKNHFALKR